MSRAFVTVCVLAILLAQVASCETKGLDRSVVERGLAGGAGSNVYRDQIRAAGDKAIPMVFDELRLHPKDDQIYYATSLVCGMAADGLLNPKALYIRAVLDNAKERESIREAAAGMLGWFWQSSDVQHALMERIEHDRSGRVRAACLAALGTRTSMRCTRTGIWKVDSAVVKLLTDTLDDRSAVIRRETCVSIGCIAIGSLRAGVDLNWCRPLIARAKRDRDRQVRQSAVDMLLRMEQEKRKNMQ